MCEERFYQVGGHLFSLDFPKGMLSEKELEPYAPFQTDYYVGYTKLFNLSIVDVKDSLPIEFLTAIDLEDENGKMSIFPRDDGSLTICLSEVSGFECCRIWISNTFSNAKAWIGGSPCERRYSLDTVLMLLYTFSSSNHDTLLVHASAIENEGKGYLFLGKSGTGKSTHSRLWLGHIKGSKLLNDDNPILRIIDGKVYVYGSPWSGKTPCYNNRKVPVGGIVRLHQAPRNNVTLIKGIKAYAALLPSCSYMKWNHEMAAGVHATISKVIEETPVFSLECLPDQEAAELCHTELKKQ